jgi:hypothetical protein
MLEVDQKKRPTAREAVTHNWFKQDEEIIKEMLSLNQSICRSGNS